MRESIGATYIFAICLTFIILFTAYLAISLNYAKAFRIKSHVVSMIEENEGYNESLDESIENYIVNEGYSASGRCPDSITENTNSSYERFWELASTIDYNKDPSDGYNICIYQLSKDDKEDIAPCKSYYKVVNFFRFDIPVIRYFSSFKVSGETKQIYDFAGCV